MLLKMYALTGTALILWIAPLYALDKKVSWHRAIQGLSLMAAFNCAMIASATAKRLSEIEAYENAKKAVLIGDLQDELAQGAYLSEQERKLQNQKYLQGLTGESNESAPELRTKRESLERLFNASSVSSGELRTTSELTSEQRELINSIRELKLKGLGKNKILKEIWGVSAGDNEAYRKAKAEYELLLHFLEGEVGE